MTYLERKRSLPLAILFGACIPGVATLLVGLLAYFLGWLTESAATFNGVRFEFSPLTGVVVYAAIVTVISYILICFPGLPVWVISSSIFSKHWLIASLIGPLLFIGLAGALARSTGAQFGWVQILIPVCLTSAIGFTVWKSYYANVESVEDVF